MRKEPVREPTPRTSIVAVHDGTIRALLAAAPEISAPAVLERLRGYGYTGGLTVVRQRLRVLRDKPHVEAFLKLDFAPGEIVQVDWADFGFALPQGQRERNCRAWHWLRSHTLLARSTLQRAARPQCSGCSMAGGLRQHT
jgi:transposase